MHACRNLQASFTPCTAIKAAFLLAAFASSTLAPLAGAHPFAGNASDTSAPARQQDEEEDQPFEETRSKLDWDLVLDFRMARTGGEISWLDRGLGKTRYGSDADGVAHWLGRLAQTSFALDASLTNSFSSHIHLNAALEPENLAGDRTGQAVSLVEGFVNWELSFPGESRLTTKAGMFFPPISLEHPGAAWSTVFSITPSVINSWVGEEIRTSGVELTWSKQGLSQEARIVGAAFINNDPAGALLAYRGFAQHDRQTAWFDELPLAPIPSIESGGLFADQAVYSRPTDELDDRVGYYGGVFWENYQWFQLSGLYYDNQGKPDRFVDGQYAWRTRFAHASLNLFLGDSAELLFQWMNGDSEMGLGPGRPRVLIDFDSYYLMGTKSFGSHRLSLRYDWFRVVDKDPFLFDEDNSESGSSWTIAYLFDFNERFRLAAEWLRVESERFVRTSMGLPSDVAEPLFQLSFRLTL